MLESTFEALNRIGKGSSCQVYKVLNKKDNKVYAIKISSSLENEEIIKNEVTIFKIFNNECPYLIHFYNFFKSKNELNKSCLCIQLEYCEYGNIREIIKKGRKKGIKLNELEISSIIYMVLKGINFIHKKNLIDRDIKGRNILVGNNGSIKLCDFGICKEFMEGKMRKFRGGSPYWIAPEILRKEEYNQSVDIWALGITCIELAEYEPPYSDLSPETVMKKIVHSPPKGLSNPSKWSIEFNDFISNCLNVDKHKRPLSDELLKHNFITMIDKKNLNRNLIIIKFLSKCGYKVLYNKKERIPGQLSMKKKTYYQKVKLDKNYIKHTNFKNMGSVDKIFNKKKNNNNNNNIIYINNNIINKNYSPTMVTKNQKQKEFFKYKPFSRKIYLRPRSVEKIDYNEPEKKNDIPYFACNTSNGYYSRSSHKKSNNNVIYLNITNFRNTNHPKFDNNSLNKYDKILNEENETNDFDANEEALNFKIKSLVEERDLIVKNIMDKYEDEISKFTQEKNELLMKNTLKNEHLKKNRNLAKKGVNTIDSYKNIIKNDVTLSTTTYK